MAHARIPSGRVPIADDAAAIAERLAELQAERARLIAGCHCPRRDTTGEIVHILLCPLRPAPASALEVAREAIVRARARLRTPPPAVPERRIEGCAGVPTHPERS